MPNEAMFSIEARQDPWGQVIVMGQATRKRAKRFINIPVSDELRERLDKQLVCSLAMGTGTLLQWALDELERQGISIEARARG